MDRAYNDYKLFDSWTENGIYFVTRMKGNADYTVIEENLIPISGNVLSDQLIQFNGFYAQRNYPDVLRRVVVWDGENECEIVLLTNHLKFAANTISAIYKDRRQIEARDFDFSMLRRLAGTGWWVSLIQIGTMLVINVDLLLINVMLGANATGRYGSLLQWLRCCGL